MLESFFSIGFTENTTELEKERHKFFLIMGGLMSMGGLMWGGISFLYELYLPSLIPFGYFIFTILNFVGFYLSKNFRVASVLQVFFSLLLPFLFQWLIGGFVSSGAIMLWAMVALTGAMTFEQLQTSTKWLIVYMLMVIATSLSDGYFQQYALNLPSDINTLFFALNIGIVSAVVFGLFFFFKYRLEKSVELEKEKQRVLEERERELNDKNQQMLASEEELRQNAEELHATNESLVAREKELYRSNELLKSSTDELMQNSELLLTMNSQLEATTQELEITLKSEQASKLKLEETYEQLKLAQSQLLQSEKMSSLGQMTAGVAHEINNPINFVSGGIQSLESVFEDLLLYLNQYKDIENLSPEQFAERITKIREIKEEVSLEETLEDFTGLMHDIKHGADRTADIVKGLKNFSRLDGGEFHATDIHEGLDSTLMLLRSKMADINLRKEYDKNMLPVLCFPSELNQVFMNLIANAIDAMQGKGDLVIATKEYPQKVEISIQDSGIGMSQSVIEKIFEPFFTTKEIGKGTGLGLSISYGIIQKHKGELLVESQEGKGTKFTIVIPKGEA